MSTTVQLQPFGAVAEFPIVTISVQEVVPTTKYPAVAPPAFAPSVQPLLVVNFVPTEIIPAALTLQVLSAAVPFPQATTPAAVLENPVSGPAEWGSPEDHVSGKVDLMLNAWLAFMHQLFPPPTTPITPPQL